MWIIYFICDLKLNKRTPIKLHLIDCFGQWTDCSAFSGQRQCKWNTEIIVSYFRYQTVLSTRRLLSWGYLIKWTNNDYPHFIIFTQHREFIEVFSVMSLMALSCSLCCCLLFSIHSFLFLSFNYEIVRKLYTILNWTIIIVLDVMHCRDRKFDTLCYIRELAICEVKRSVNARNTSFAVKLSLTILA